MISTVQSYTNPVRSFYRTAPIHMLEVLRHSTCSHSCYVPMQVYNSICMLIKTLRSDCIGNTVLATATLVRESTYTTCPVNPFWQVTACRNINYLNCLSGLITVMTVHSTKNKTTGNVRQWRTQEFCSRGGSTNSVEDRGQREQESGGR